MTRAQAPGSREMQQIRRDSRFRAAVRHAPPQPNWRAQGLCLRLDPELFFPETLEDPSRALRACDGCPVLGECLATALDLGECEGVWGATTPRERRQMRPVWLRMPTAAPVAP